MLLAGVLLGVGLLFPKGSLVNTLVDSTNNEWYINNFFSQKNSKEVLENACSDNFDIVIVDIKEDSLCSREKIAKIIEKVSVQHPKLVCVDFAFKDNDSFDTIQSNILQRTIAEVKDSVNLVVISSKGRHNEIEHSFFTQDLNLHYGLSNFFGFGEYVKYVDDTIPRISLKMAEMLKKNIHNLPDHFIVNYRPKSFNPVKLETDTDIAKIDTNHNFSDFIVLIGQTENFEDIHVAPFFILKDEHRISGTEIIAYELTSILSYLNDSKDKKKIHENNQHPYTFLPWYCNMISLLVMLVLYASIVFLLNRCKRGWKWMLSPIVLLSLECLLIAGCFFIITERFFKIPNISLFAVSLLFVDPMCNLSMYLIKKWKS